ncbi:MAG TPA: GNAT family N-acetyltransferase [Candidatus Saccharimonadia bacterium]|jgi:GNAT superfamily N-acetyltransferase
MSRHLIYKIVEADKHWADEYRMFCQKAYQAAYPRPERGVTKDLFSEAIFNSPRIKTYFNELLSPSESNKFWLALDDNNHILGGAGATNKVDHIEMQAFYVSENHQGQGIGRALYEKVKRFAGKLPIEIEVIEYMEETIKTYEHWGFRIDPSRAKVTYPWTEWPDDAIASYQAIHMVRPVPK